MAKSIKKSTKQRVSLSDPDNKLKIPQQLSSNNPQNTGHSLFCGFFDTFSHRKLCEVLTGYLADTGEYS
jgi:hypothetical protein